MIKICTEIDVSFHVVSTTVLQLQPILEYIQKL
jgi:hypothetical protein